MNRPVYAVAQITSGGLYPTPNQSSTYSSGGKIFQSQGEAIAHARNMAETGRKGTKYGVFRLMEVYESMTMVQHSFVSDI